MRQRELMGYAYRFYITEEERGIIHKTERRFTFFGITVKWRFGRFPAMYYDDHIDQWVVEVTLKSHTSAMLFEEHIETFLSNCNHGYVCE